MLLRWLKKRLLSQAASPSFQTIKSQEPSVLARGVFSTDFHALGKTAAEIMAQRRAVLARTFQHGIEALSPVNDKGESLPGFAMDEAYPDLQQAKLITSAAAGWLPETQFNYFASQGFIGWQTCALLSQHWLIDKAVTMPAKDAVRHGWDVSRNDGEELDPGIQDELRRLDKRFGVKRNLIEFVKMGRIFGVRICMFIVDGVDYAAPFNPDGIAPGAYKGITQIDPYWVAPEFDRDAAANPAATDFYEPTWWRINGRRVHRSHLVIMRNGDNVPDILKPSYIYGGIPTPQKIYERVYAAERTANEAPMLAMTKRLTSLKIDATQALTDPDNFSDKMQTWIGWRDNFGVKVIGEGEEIEQFDTSLAELDATIMTQYQLVAAAAEIPATKLLGTTPKGFNSTGEYDESSYHEMLESLQANDLTPLLERHYLLLVRSHIAPKAKISPFNIEIAWRPVDSPTARELAETNKLKADTDAVLVNAGAIDGYDVRQRIIADPMSGYSGIEEVVPDGPGDREAQQEAEAALEQPVTAKTKQNAEKENTDKA